MAGENRILDVIEQFQKNPGFVVLGFEYTDDEEGKHRVYLDRSEEPMIIKIGKTEFTSDLLDIYKSEAEQEEVFSEWEALQARELSSLSEEETKRFHELQFKTEVLNLLQDLDERGVSEQIEESYSEKIATLNAGLTEMGNPSAAFLRGSIRAVAFQLDGHSITAEKARDKDGKVHAYYTMDGAVVRAGSPIMTEFAELWDKDNPEKFSSTFIDAYKENVHAMGRVNELTKRFLASDLEEVDFSYHEDNQENASKVKIKRRPVLKENGEYGDEASITINDQEIGDSPKDQLLFYDLVKTAGKNFSFSYEGALDKAISSHVLDGREEVSNAKLHVGELVEDAIGAVIKKMDLARIGRMSLNLKNTIVKFMRDRKDTVDTKRREGMKDDLPGLVVRIDGKKVTRKELETFIKNNREEFCNAFNAEIALAMRERDIRNKNYGYGEKEIEEIEKAFARDVKKPVEEKTVEHPNIENENFYNQEVREEDQLMIRSLREQYLGHDLWVREGQIKSNGRAADQDGLGLRLAERNKEIKGKPYFIVTHHYLSNTGKKKTIAYRVQVSSHERENKGKKETSWELFVNGTRITYDPNKTTDFGNRDNTVGFLRTVVGVDPDQFEQKFETMVEELPHIQEKLEETEPFKAFLDSNEKELSVPFEEEDGTSHTLSIYKIKEENGEEQLAYKLDHVEIDEANKADFYSAIIAAGGIQEGSRFLEEMQKAIKLREQVRVRMKLLEKYEKKTGLPLKELDKKDELDTVMREALSLKKREEVEDMLVWFNTERISSVEQLVDNLHTYHTAFQKNNVYEINGQKLEVLAEYDEEDFKELGQWMKKNGARLAKGILKAGSRDFIHEAKSLVRRAPHGFARVMKIIVPQVAVVMDGKQVPMR